MRKIKLTNDSAMLINRGNNFFSNDVIERFKEYFDLSDITNFQGTQENKLYEESYLNKEFIIDKYIYDELNRNDDKRLLVILSPGISPLSVEILKRYDNKIDKILEIDFNDMEEKQQLYDSLYPEFAEKIKCMNADFQSPAMIEIFNMLLQEYYNSAPAIIILNGISYFLDKDDVSNLISGFGSKSGKNILIMDVLKPIEEVSGEIQIIRKKIKDSAKKKSLDSRNLNDLVSKLNVNLVKRENLTNIEFQRTGSNKYFSLPEYNWLECAVIKI